MRQKTELEKLADRGQTIRLEICEMRSPLRPKPWEIDRFFRWHVLKYRVKCNRRKLSPETQSALAWAEEALERELFYGKDT